MNRPHVATLQADDEATLQGGSHTKKPRSIGSDVERRGD
jgi:hypothetical protein